MNKGEFITYISEKNTITKAEAAKMLDMFTSSVIDALGAGKEISLSGFGNFLVSKVAARDGRNPQTGASIKIPAYNQPKFKVGKTMKDAVNKK
jgi:DNA-binding protein HU-beta